MIRAVLAVSLSVAIISVASPAIDDARSTRSDKLVQGELIDVEQTVRTLDANEPAVPVGSVGARRVVSIQIPERSQTSAAVKRVVIGGVPNGGEELDTKAGDVLSYTSPNGARRVIRLDGVDIRVARQQGGKLEVERDDAPLVLRPGTHRLVFRPVRIDGAAVILVHRLKAEF